MLRRVFLQRTATSLAIASVGLSACTASMTASRSTNIEGGQRTSTDRRREITAGADASLDRLYTAVPSARELVAKASGMLVFPRVLAAGLGIGGEYGEGVLRAPNTPAEFYSIGAISIGLQAGAQSKAIILLFMSPEALTRLRTSKGWAAGVDASVAILKVGANGNIDTSSMSGPVLAFVLTNAGLMANLTLEGTKITRIQP